jgi:hypothetical protein
VNRLIRFWLAVWLSCVTASAMAQDRVYLATMAPGALYYENFGHNALIIERSGQRPVAYNFGYFDFASAGFLQNFVLGKMAYLGVQIDADADIGSYLSKQRTVWLDELWLSPEQINLLEATLRAQTTPPNDVYRYDYFRANCSTKIRDALNHVLGERLHQQLSNRSHGYTFRGLGLAHAQLTTWQYIGIHAGLGPSTDKNLSIWQESFIPVAFRNALVDAKLAAFDGSPLIRATRTLGPKQDSVLPATPNYRLHFFMSGMLLAIAISLGFRFRDRLWLRRASASLAFLVSLAIGLGGTLLLFFWFATDHTDADWNLNLLLFSPLGLVLVLRFWNSWGEQWRSGNDWPARWFVYSVAACAILKTLPMIRQVNLEWLLFFAPIAVALQFGLRRNVRS